MSELKIFDSVGNKYYTYENDKEESLKLIRVVGIQNTTDVKIKILDSPNKEEIGNINKIKFKELEDWTRLIGYGKIIFSTVTVGTNTGGGITVPDVIVAGYSYKEAKLSGQYTKPFVACRQCIGDVYDSMMQESPELSLVGMSCNQMSIPEGIEFDALLACTKIDLTSNVTFYIDDTLDDILNMVKTKPYDKVLESDLLDHVNYMERKLGRKIGFNSAIKSCDGYCRDLRQLLEENNFWYDLQSYIGIIKINVPVEIDTEDINRCHLSEDLKIDLSNILMKNIGETWVIKYDLDIDIDTIKKDHFLLMDSNNILWVVCYETIGEYIAPDKEVEDIKDAMKNSILDVNMMKYQDRL